MGNPNTNMMKILSLNLGQLPFPLGIKDRKKRARELVNKVLMMDSEDDENTPDIVCFQELFSRSSRRIVIKGLSDIYPYWYADNSRGRHVVGVNSGLAIFSKHQIVDHTFTDCTQT